MPFNMFRENSLVSLINKNKFFSNNQLMLSGRRVVIRRSVKNHPVSSQTQNFICQGILTIYATRNNTHALLINIANKIIIKKSLGTLKKGNIRKKSVYANYLLGCSFGKALKNYGIKVIGVQTYGFNRGQIDFLRGLRENQIEISHFVQNINQPHNGCRPKKSRRLL